MVKRWTHGNDLFWEHKNPNEELGFAVLTKADFNFDLVEKIPNRIKDYLTTGIFMESNPHTWHFESPQYRTWQDNIESYVKTVWLSRDFINDGKLKNPVGAHWNPDIEKWTIHPGGSRQIILYHYVQDQIECVAFNTKGLVDINFLKIFKSIEDIKQYTNTTNVHLSIVEQHDTLIPHVHLDNHTIQDNVHSMHKQIQDFYFNTKLITNFDLKPWGYKEIHRKVKRTKQKKTLKVTVDTVNTETISRAFMLMPSFDNFEGYGVKIERT